MATWIEKDGTLRVSIPPSLQKPLPTELMAVEYGFKAAERGWNLEKTLAEFKRVFKEKQP